jgi:putative peptidoglycan lipid II flippase
MRITIWITLAATVGAVALAHPLIALVFERGNFDTRATAETAKAFMAQGIGIWMVAAVRQLVAVYYAFGDTKTPVKVAAIDLISFIVSAQVLAPKYGHVGVGLAVSIASLTQMLLLWRGLRGRLPSLQVKVVLRTFVQSLGLSALAALLARMVAAISQRFVHHGWHRHVVPGLLSSLVFIGAFLLLAKLFKSPELELLRPTRHRKS